MAKRRALARALAGLGEGIGNASQLMLRQSMQDRYDQKIADRQTAAADRQFTEALQKAVAEGLEPSQAVAMAKSRNIDLDPAMLEAVRPTMRKRLGASLDKPIMDAKAPEEVPSLQDIASAGKGQGAFLPDEFMVADARTDNTDPMLGASGELQEYAGRAETKRRSLENALTETVTGVNAAGQPYTQKVSRSSLQQPFVTGPTPAQKGVFAGQETKAKIDTSGGAEAEQAGREATATTTATTDVQNSPKNVNARVDEARKKRSAELAVELAQSGMTPQQQSAALQLSDDFFTQSKDYFETATAFRKIATSAQRIREARQSGSDSPASNIGMVFAYMKMLDPQSTVREGEQAQARDARGVPDAVLSQYNALVNGGKLSDAQIADFTSSAGSLYQSAKQDQAGRIQDFTNRATQYRVPPALVVREPDISLDTLGQSGAQGKVLQRGGGR